MNIAETLSYALLGGIVPALVWLVFWLHEDSKRPEPKGRLAETFLFGMLAVLVVIPFQELVAKRFGISGVSTFVLWAVLEEGFKFMAGWFGGLRSVDDDEPLDPLVYMITASLGFVALENALFVASPLLAHNILGGIVTGGLRFVGANLLHIIASAAVGSALALSFYKSVRIRMIALVLGIAFAVLFHTAFNLAIVDEALSPFLAFGIVWAGAATLLWIFERVKAIPSPDVSPRGKQ